MNKRIKEIRLAQSPKMSQDAFGARLGITGAAVSRIESGHRAVTDQVIISICREFGVDEKWLRTGKGKMYASLDRRKKIAAFLGDMMHEDDGSFKVRLIELLSDMTPEEWELMEKMARRLTAAPDASKTPM